MKKSTLMPKEISKKRLATSKLMKLEQGERYNLANKENENPQLFPMQKSCYRVHDRVISECNARNPFDIPNHNRLFSKSKGVRKTKPEPFILSEPHTICNIDSTFYKIIEGRPLRQFNDIKVYMRNIRDITLFKANAAYLKDQIIQVETSTAFELAEYNAISDLFYKCKDNFVQFAKESYTKAKYIQKLAAEKAIQLDNVTEELESLSFEYVAVRNKLGVINITFETLSKYRQFLNSLSPVWWREANDQEFGSVLRRKVIIEEKQQSGMSLNKYSALLTNAPAKLFFKKPRQMMQIFDNLGRQCLTYMEIDVFAANLVSSVVKSKNHLKAQVVHEINELEDLVAAYKSYVQFMEVREKEFKEKFERILINDFQELYASYDVSKLFTCVQYTNTQVFGGPEDPKDGISALMLQLEKEYTALTSGLDDLNQEVVKLATDTFFSEDIKMMKRAHLAQRHLKECDILSKALYASFEPSRRPKNK